MRFGPCLCIALKGSNVESTRCSATPNCSALRREAPHLPIAGCPLLAGRVAWATCPP